jgi:class 3 adenylate cyclase
MVAAPSGTVTFLFTDIQGSTRLWQDDQASMATALKRHDEIMKKTVAENNGHVFKTVGDAFCCAFSDAGDAIRTALAAQIVIGEEQWETPRPIRVRMSIHTGSARERDNDYFGPPVNKVARIESLAHGGQVIMSRITADLVKEILPEGVTLREMGSHRLKDLATPEDIYQLVHPDLPKDFPPLKSMDALPNNLPVQTTPLIGREKELKSIKELFTKKDCRLVSLVGARGYGKNPGCPFRWRLIYWMRTGTALGLLTSPP